MSVSGKLKAVRIISVKPQLTVVSFMQQYSSGIHPHFSYSYIRKAGAPIKMKDYVKENRFAIITIMLKQIAVEMREKWPHLHIKAHPMQWGTSRARLVIREKDTRVIFDVQQGALIDWRIPSGPRKEDPNEYNVRVKVTIGNDVSKKKTPQPWSFSLDDPTSTETFEAWVDTVVKEWINVETESSVDNDGSTEV
jgi:hypothetical protein